MTHIPFSKRSDELHEVIALFRLMSDEEIQSAKLAADEVLENRAFERENRLNWIGD